MAVDVNLYRDREQTYIKHLFLSRYLEAAAYRTLQKRSPIFNFVDAFAGPWKVSDETEYSDASFHQAVRTLEAVRVGLGKTGIGGLQIRFCFCERRAERVAELRRYAESKPFEIHVFEGAFEDNLSAIATAIPHGFTFTFIDPTGWDIRSAEVFRFLRLQRGEFLLNFMSEHINRHATYAAVSRSFGRFLAEPEWESDFAALPHEWGNEQRMLNLLKQKMREAGVATYLPDLAIKKNREERIKMRLVLGTHSSIGVEVFREVQKKVEKAEIETRYRRELEGLRQISLFSDEQIVAFQQNHEGVDCPRYQQAAEQHIVDLLSGRSSARFEQIASEAMSAVPIRKPEVNKLLIRMKRQGAVDFELPARARVPRPNTLIRLAR